eukprot:g1735.t1
MLQKTKLFSLSQIEKAVAGKEDAIVDLMRDGFIKYSEGSCSVPPIQTLGAEPYHNFTGSKLASTCVKSGYIKDAQYYVTKIASGGFSGFPNTGLMLVFSQVNGLLDAILFDEGMLTELRTAAAGALAYNLFAPEHVTVIGMIGAGVQARWQLKLLKSQIPEYKRKEVTVLIYCRNKTTAEKCAFDVQMEGWCCETVHSAAVIAKMADVIVCTTPSRETILKSEWFDFNRNVLITAIGADTPGKKELDVNIVKKANLLVCDSLLQTQERGEFQHAIKEKVIDIGDVKEIGKLCSSRPQFKKASGITIFDSSGVAVQDVMIATMAFEALLLFRCHDLRLRDNLALASLAKYRVVPVFFWSVSEQGRWGVNGAARVYLESTLYGLSSELKQRGVALIVRKVEDTAEAAAKLAVEVGASRLDFNFEHTPEGDRRERELRKALAGLNIACHGHQSTLLYDLRKINLQKGFQGGHFLTLMPFLRSCKKSAKLSKPIDAPLHLHKVEVTVKSDSISELGLTKMKPWEEKIKACNWNADEESAQKCSSFFISNGLQRYERERSRADKGGSTSKLSMLLRFGVLSPRDLYDSISTLPPKIVKTFGRRLFWRDLAYFQLKIFPNMRTVCIRKHYEDVEWVMGEEKVVRLNAWKEGRTGYPMVDAGMRELYATGWMTQSVRMICASFLIEYLRIDWKEGLNWFHETLIDADPAINAMMWQNAGASGIDQWNFTMNPVNASQDPTGEYARKWVKELKSLPTKYLHQPWKASEQELKKAGIKLGKNYPDRIVTDLQRERRIRNNSILKMRRKHQNRNDDNGYDLIMLSDKTLQRVFTKKSFRIDRSGNVKPTKPKGQRPQKRRKRSKNKK